MKRLFFYIGLMVFGLSSSCFAYEVEKVFYKDGALKEEIIKEDEEIFITRKFYLTGQIASMNVFAPRKFNESYTYFLDGKIKSRSCAVDQENKTFVQEFNDNGLIFIEVETKGAEVVRKLFDENGLRQKCIEKKNIEKCTRYDQDGKVLRDGVSKGFYKNGKLLWEQGLKDGKLNGLSRFYYSNGQIKNESSFKNDNLIGDQKFYTRNGVLTCEINYPYEFNQWNFEKEVENGYVTKISYSDSQGKCFGSLKAYDEQGKMIFHYYCDGAGKPITEIYDGFKDNSRNLYFLGEYPDRIKTEIVVWVDANPLPQNGSKVKIKYDSEFQNNMQKYFK